jgi:hypothetical protein
MATSALSEKEREELRVTLRSGIFAKAPRQAKLLEYVCNEYFEGRSEQIKEYNLATEVLGRTADFDQNRDAIVRVEIHRLRHKLKEYYEGEGAGHTLRIVIDPGHYVPRFVPQEETPSIEPHGNSGSPRAPGPMNVLEPSSPLAKRVWTWLPTWRGRPLAWILVCALAFALLTAGAALVALKSKHVSSQIPGPASPVLESREVVASADSRAVASADSQQGIRILAGYSKSNYTDHMGQVWGPDRYYSGGTTRSAPPQFIDRTSDATLYQNCRAGDFSYDIPLKPGVYELGLFFAETIYGQNTLAGGGEGSRTFNVELNGKPILTEFDPLADAGANYTADKRVFVDVRPAADWKLHLHFSKFVGPTPPQDEAILNAIEVIPGIPGKMRPVRIVAQTNSYTDHSGRVWSPDLYASQGRLALHNRPVEHTADPGLYYGERYGHFSYAIPVAPGRQYGLTLHFAETYFGPQNPGNGGAGSRRFDVYCNGVALLRNFDLFKEAGGANRALEKTFHALPASATGKLLLTFVPVKNYACVNAIEVVDESQ